VRVETASDVLARLLAELGVEYAFGVIGGSIAPLADALAHSKIRVLHFRHEAGAGFAAIEASLAAQRPVVVFASTGPGLTNALTGAHSAWWERAQVIVVSACTPAAQRGRWAIQETSASTAAGAPFDYATVVQDVDQLPAVAARLAAGLARLDGFVAHVSLSIDLQPAPARAVSRPHIAIAPPAPDPRAIEQCATRIGDAHFAIWIGYGARGAADSIRALAERTGAAVMATPRGKGIFPEDHRQYVGVTGFAGHAEPAAHVASERPRLTLVLGTRLGEFSSAWSNELAPEGGFIHVDVDPTVFGAAYPTVPTFGVISDIDAFVRALTPLLPARRGAIAWPRCTERPAPAPERAPVRPACLIDAVQHVLVDRGETLVLAESGNAFAWANHLLRFRRPGQYRVSTGFGSMGHASAGVVGAALARRGKAIALVGDGALLMQCEISTAVQYQLDAVWIVLNDAMYGMVAHGMRAQRYEPVETEIPRADFVAIARGLGADGVRVDHERDLVAALKAALAARGPFVVDVQIDGTAVPPFASRISGLVAQGALGNRRE
jgi:acetolactate synthase I/II/III large subunit